MGTQIDLHSLDEVMSKLRLVEINTIRRAVEATQITAANMENDAQDKAPWHDRTGNARASIYAWSDVTPAALIIYHGIGVDYGVFLELSNGGKYRIIGPTVERYRSIWQRNLSGILGL